MASGVVVASGQNFVTDQVNSFLNSSGVYVGLMTNSTTPLETSQLGNGITEVSGSGYERQSCSTWTKYNDGGVDPYLEGSTVTFNVSGLWSNVNGYFVSLTASGNDLFWSQLFPVAYQGDKNNGDSILVTPQFETKDVSEL